MSGISFSGNWCGPELLEELVVAEEGGEELRIEDIAWLEAIARVGLDGAQIVEIAGVCQLVEIQDTRRFRGNPLENEVRAYEARATGDEDEIFHAGYAASCEEPAFRF